MTAVVKPRAIVIGTSAGGISALSEILPALPADFTIPTIIVVHLRGENKSTLSQLFGSKCQIPVKEAEDKELIRRGVIYFAPPNYHLLVEANGSLSLSSEEPELFSRPSINVLFDSAADAYGTDLIGIVLSGSNEDGAEGLAAISTMGGMAVIQEPRSAHASVMPEAARKACPDAKVMSPNQIAGLLVNISGDTDV